MKSSRILNWAVLVGLCVGLAANARASTLGYTQLNNFSPTTVGQTGGTSLQSSDSSGFSGSTPPPSGPLPSEYSATWTFGSPQSIGSVILFPNSTPINNQPYRYQIYTNGVLAVDQTWAAEGSTEYLTKPQVVNAGWTGVTSIKLQQANITRLNSGGYDQIRDLSGMYALSERVDKLLSPSSATSNVGWNNLTFTYDGVRNGTPAITTLATATSDAWITYNFGTPQVLSGLLINVNNFDDPTQFAWNTWKVYDAPGGNLLIDKPFTTNDRYQLVMFPNGAATLSSFTLEGPMNPDTGVSGRGRLGEVFGIVAVPEPSVTLLAVLGTVHLWLFRRARSTRAN